MSTFTEDNIKESLRIYEDLMKLLEKFEADKKAKLKSIIPPEIQQELDAVEAEMNPKISVLLEKINGIKNSINERTIQLGFTVNGENYDCIYNQGKNSYSQKPKKGYIKAEVYVKTGNPTAYIRAAKEKGTDNE